MPQGSRPFKVPVMKSPPLEVRFSCRAITPCMRITNVPAPFVNQRNFRIDGISNDSRITAPMAIETPCCNPASCNPRPKRPNNAPINA